jgi:hypothetical protein
MDVDIAFRVILGPVTSRHSKTPYHFLLFDASPSFILPFSDYAVGWNSQLYERDAVLLPDIHCAWDI